MHEKEDALLHVLSYIIISTDIMAAPSEASVHREAYTMSERHGIIMQGIYFERKMQYGFYQEYSG